MGDEGGLNMGLPGGSNWKVFRVSNGPGACLFLAIARATSASTASFLDDDGMSSFLSNCQELRIALMLLNTLKDLTIWLLLSC